MTRTTMILTVACIVASARGGDRLAPPFDETHEVVSLGAPTGVPSPIGGVTFGAGDVDRLFVVGQAGTAAAAIRALPLVRSPNGDVVAIDGPAFFFAAAPGVSGGGANGSLGAFGDPDDVLLTYATTPDDGIGIVDPAGGPLTQVQSLDALFVGAVHVCRFAPPMFAGSLPVKALAGDPAQWHAGAYFINKDHSLLFGAFQPIVTIDGDPRSIEWIPGAIPGFDGRDSVLVAKRAFGRVDGYRVDAAGDPIDGSEFGFIAGLAGLEGLALDPVTGAVVVSVATGSGEILLVRPLDGSCPADTDGNGVVDIDDVISVILDFGTDGSANGGDVDGSGLVDIDDVVFVVLAFGECPGV